jgi:hypothetical protein
MKGYLHTIKLFSDLKITFHEINLQQYINLLKCFFGDNIVPEIIFSNTDYILKQIIATKSIDLKTISFIDYILLLIYIRAVSIGDTLFLNLQDEKFHTLKLELSLDRFISNITKQIPKINTQIDFNICKIQLDYPSIFELLHFEQSKDYSILNIFIKKIITNNNEINLNEFNFAEKDIIVQKLPVKVISILNKNITEIIEQLNKINLLQDYIKSIDKSLPFTINTQILGFITKLIFNNSLENIYENIFVLAKAGNLQSNFLYNCSPGEFFLYVKKLEEYAAKQQVNSKQNNSSDNDLPPIESEADFGLE